MSLAPRWQKAMRDLLSRPGRSLLAVLAMALGLLELGAMLYAYAMLRPALTTLYAQSRPSAATLAVSGVEDSLLAPLLSTVRRVPGVADAESHPMAFARAGTGRGEWTPAVLFFVHDFDHQRMDVVTHEQGAWPPGPGDVLLERSALTVAHVQIGDSLTLRTAGGEDRRMRVAGTVHAAGLAPAWMEHMVPVFAVGTSPLRAGAAEQVRFTVAQRGDDEGWIHLVADSVKASLERAGHPVARVTVPPPGKHPHADQMAAFLFLLGAFGLLSLVLGAVLTASMVHALLGEQVREIGIMKAIGASTRQVAGIALAQVAALALVSLAAGVPMGLALGRAYARFAAGILNADLTHTPFPYPVLAAELVAGLAIPLLVAMVPVLQASRITVREALAGGGAQTFGARRLERALLRVHGVPRPLLLSLRTTLQKRGRLALTVGTLALGGAAFIAALDVAEGWNTAVERDFECRRYALSVQLTESQPITTLARVLRSVPGVARAEYWAGANPWLVDSAGIPVVQIPLAGLESGSTLLALPLREGRWLRPGDGNVLVVNQTVALRTPALHVGGQVRLRVRERTVAFTIVGIVRELAPMPVLYAPRAAVLALSGEDGALTRSARIVTRTGGEAVERATATRVEEALAREGLEVANLQRMTDARKGLLDHLVIIQSVLTTAASIVVVVGLFALISTLSLSVVQRTRELGVMRAIGATPRVLAGQVWAEALVIGALSALVANLLAVPLTYLLETATGNIFLKTPLAFHMGAIPSLTWVALVLALATLSSLYPAWRAARLTVREALAYA